MKYDSTIGRTLRIGYNHNSYYPKSEPHFLLMLNESRFPDVIAITLKV